jgi:hypothetical protein
MNETGRLAYRDQRAAEDALANYRHQVFEFVDRIRELNEQIDSHKLHEFMEKHGKSIAPF